MKYVYIHGRGSHDDLTLWRQAWSLRLEEAGHVAPELGDDAWIEVDYQDLLGEDFTDEPRDWPSAPAVPGEARLAYVDRNAALRGAVEPPPSVSPVGVAEKAVDVAASVFSRVPMPKQLAQKGVTRLMKDVRLFRESRERRDAIIHRILAAIPPGDVVIIAHSLGTVALLSAIAYLPADTRVRLLITAGSPAATETMATVAALAGASDGPPFPVDRVHSWLNLVDVWDPITSGNGLGDTFDCVIDHRTRNAKREEGATSVHSIWSYLKSPVIETAIRLCLDEPAQRAIEPSVATRLDGDELNDIFMVRLADCMSISAGRSQVHQRTRDFIDTRLLPQARESSGGATVTRRSAAVTVERWAERQSVVWRVAMLIEASQAAPFAPFDPGLEDSDVKDALDRYSRDLGLEPRVLADVLDLRDEIATHLARPGRLRRTLGVTALSLAAVGAVALGGPVAIGGLASSGATGAAAFTSGLAALGLGGGMATGVAALGGVATGLGLLGGVVARRAGEVAADEELFLTLLVTELVHVRVLRRTGDEAARTVAAERRRRLDGDVREQLVTVKADHERFASGGSKELKAIDANIGHLSTGIAWLDAARDVDEAAAALT